MLEAETIFDSTHAKIHIVTSKGWVGGKAEGWKRVKRKRKERRWYTRAERAANRRVCKCSTRGCNAVMEEKNCLFQRPAFSRADYPPGNLDCGLCMPTKYSRCVCDDRGLSPPFSLAKRVYNVGAILSAPVLFFSVFLLSFCFPFPFFFTRRFFNEIYDKFLGFAW